MGTGGFWGSPHLTCKHFSRCKIYFKDRFLIAKLTRPLVIFSFLSILLHHLTEAQHLIIGWNCKHILNKTFQFWLFTHNTLSLPFGSQAREIIAAFPEGRKRESGLSVTSGRNSLHKFKPREVEKGIYGLRLRGRVQGDWFQGLI